MKILVAWKKSNVDQNFSRLKIKLNVDEKFSRLKIKLNVDENLSRLKKVKRRWKF